MNSGFRRWYGRNRNRSTNTNSSNIIRNSTRHAIARGERYLRRGMWSNSNSNRSWTINSDSRRTIERARRNWEKLDPSNINNNRTRHPSSSNNKNYSSNTNKNRETKRRKLASNLYVLAYKAQYRKKQRIAKKWLNARPWNLRRDPMVIVPSKNTIDLITHDQFEPGESAVMVLYKRMQGQRMRTKRFFLTRNSLAQLSGKPWRVIDRMKASNIVLKKSPINRRLVYRRDVMNVKFVPKRKRNSSA